MADNKDCYIQIRVSEAEKAQIEQNAAAAGLKVSEWMRIRALTTSDYFEDYQEVLDE